ncbi:hypothetical protein [Bacillus pretiosus]|uniref:Uncharacterized protein n=1 Tax=Bacillus pretiosus TaxID=2983392 RepID=A0ABT3EWW6_9BACI|nr:hypothetical protein [Bacillus pretiosus]MCW1241316.1 hypothetical protein [Bacillus pretiosus]
MNLKYRNGFYVREDIHGETVLVSQKNLGECIEYINRFNISGVQISDMYYELEDINFLSECEKLTSLEIEMCKNIGGILQYSIFRVSSRVFVRDSSLFIERKNQFV